MNDKLPFEDAFERKMNNLPTGDEDASWDKMKMLLEKKDKRKPFAWMLYYILSSLLLTGLITTWMMLSHGNKAGKQVTVLKNKQEGNRSHTDVHTNEMTNPLSSLQSKDTVSLQHTKRGPGTGNTNTLIAGNIHTSTGKVSFHKTRHYTAGNTIQFTQQKNNPHNNSYTLRNKSDKKHTGEKLTSVITSGDISENSVASDPLQNGITHTDTTSQVADTATISQQQKIATDTLVKNNDADIKKAVLKGDTNIVAKNKKPVSARQKQYSVEAGLQFNQSLPFAGQQIVSYNYDGNKNLLYDYIPSVFIKLGNKRWFFQTEFSYASPQFIKPFAYTRKTNVSYSSGIVTTTSDNLQKVYYTQLPLSFNYYIRPHLFAGIGAKFNWFHGAVTKHEVIINDLKTDSEMVATNIVPLKAFTDSFLYKSQTALFLQAGYTIKKWSFSLRYTQGLQSFITFTLPDGSISNKKSVSFQLLIDYSLFSKPLRRLKMVNK